jgi:hypothetical protein
VDFKAFFFNTLYLWATAYNHLHISSFHVFLAFFFSLFFFFFFFFFFFLLVRYFSCMHIVYLGYTLRFLTIYCNSLSYYRCGSFKGLVTF